MYLSLAIKLHAYKHMFITGCMKQYAPMATVLFPRGFQSTLICKGHIPLLQFETVYRSTSIQQLRAKACGATTISTTQTSGTQFQ